MCSEKKHEMPPYAERRPPLWSCYQGLGPDTHPLPFHRCMSQVFLLHILPSHIPRSPAKSSEENRGSVRDGPALPVFHQYGPLGGCSFPVTAHVHHSPPHTWASATLKWLAFPLKGHIRTFQLFLLCSIPTVIVYLYFSFSLAPHTLPDLPNWALVQSFSDSVHAFCLLSRPSNFYNSRVSRFSAHPHLPVYLNCNGFIYWFMTIYYSYKYIHRESCYQQVIPTERLNFFRN